MRLTPAAAATALLLALAGCAAPANTTAAPVTVTVTAGAPQKGAAPASKAPAKPAGLGEDKGWVLLTLVPHVNSGFLTADARIRNDGGDSTGVFTVSWLNAAGEVTHAMTGSVNGIAKGKTTTVQFVATTGKTIPKGTPEFAATMSG